LREPHRARRIDLREPREQRLELEVAARRVGLGRRGLDARLDRTEIVERGGRIKATGARSG